MTNRNGTNEPDAPKSIVSEPPTELPASTGTLPPAAKILARKDVTTWQHARKIARARTDGGDSQ